MTDEELESLREVLYANPAGLTSDQSKWLSEHVGMLLLERHFAKPEVRAQLEAEVRAGLARDFAYLTARQRERRGGE